MSITLTFTADTIEAAYDQMWEALRGHRHVAPEPKAPAIAKDDTAIAKRPVGRPRKVQPDPVPEIDPDPKPGWVRLGPDRQPEAVDDVDIGGMPSPDQHDDYREPNGADPDPIALEKLKQETVAKLPDMFAAGKVNLMRAVLTKYGKGAKSFPEIEAKDFPEIAAALARGDGS